MTDQETNEMQSRIMLDLMYFHRTWIKNKTEQLGFESEDNIFVNPKLRLPDREIKMDDIVNMEDRGRVILIEGDDGFGKTMLVRKLAYDWAVNNIFLTQLFNFLFVVDVKDIKVSLYNTIIDSVEEKAKKSLRHILNSRQKEILIILDGFDCASENLRKDIISYFEDQILKSITFIVTSSPFHARLLTKYCKKSIIIEGLQEQNLERFDVQLFGHNKLQLTPFHEISTHFSNFSKDEKYLRKPFLQMGMRSICYKYLPNSSATIYEELIHFIMTNSICRENFKQQTTSDQVSFLIICGKLTFYFLQKDQIQLPSKTLDLEIIQDVFWKIIISHNNPLRLVTSPFTTEYLNDILCSFYLDHLKESDKEKFSKEVKCFLKLKNCMTSLVLPLVFKTSSKKLLWWKIIEVLFNDKEVIPAQADEFQRYLITLKKLLHLNESSELLSIWPLTVEIFQEAIFSVFKNVTMDVVIKHLKLIANSYENCRLSENSDNLLLNEQWITKMPTWWNLQVAVLEGTFCVVSDTEGEQRLVHYLTEKHHVSKLFFRQVHSCSNVKLDLDRFISITSKLQSVIVTGQEGFVSQLLKKIENIRVKSVVLLNCHLNAEDMETFSLRLLNPQVTSVSLDCCTFHTDCYIEPLLPVLQALGRKQCQLKVFRISKTCLNRAQFHKFFTEVSKSKTLTDLTLQSPGECIVNVNSLCNSGQKNWDRVVLNGVSIYIPPEAMTTPFSITSLSLQNIWDTENSNVVKVLRNCKTRTLHCEDSLLKRLSEELEEDWVGYKLVKELKIQTSDVRLLLSQASPFERLLNLEWEIVNNASDWILSHSAAEWITSIRSWRIKSFKLKQEITPTLFLQNLQAIFDAMDSAPLPLDDTPFTNTLEFALQPTWTTEQFHLCLRLVKHFVQLLLLSGKVQNIFISLLEFQRWDPMPPLFFLNDYFSKVNFHINEQIQQHSQWDDYIISIERKTFD